MGKRTRTRQNELIRQKMVGGALIRRVQERKRIVLRDKNGKPQFKIKHKKKRTENGSHWEMIAVRVDSSSASPIT